MAAPEPNSHRDQRLISAPPVRAERIATADPDDCIARLRAIGMSTRHNQMSSGQYLAEIDTVLLHNLRCSLTSYQTAITSHGACVDGKYAVVLPISHVEGAFLNHHPLHGNEIGVVRPGGEFHLFRPAGFLCVVAFPDAALIDRLSQAMYGHSFSQIVRLGPTLPSDETAVASCAQRFARICSEAVFDPERLRAGTTTGGVERIERDLLDALLNIVQPPEPLRGWSSRGRIVRRAWELVEGDDQGSITVTELCVKLRVPVRTLDDAFHACLGVTPRRFILAMRLNQVRHALSRPRDDTTVTEAATRFSFFHFGHFSTQYHRLFGELPSQTLSRAKP